MGEICVREASPSASCHEFWVMCGTLALAVLVLVALLALALAIRRWRRAAMRRASARLTLEHLEMQARIADEWTMQQLKWKGDHFVTPDKDQAQLTAEIRNSLRSRKLNG
ncbi:MAG: hypothetical protein ABI790_14530 [Betaproteobacteria bacterium]